MRALVLLAFLAGSACSDPGMSSDAGVQHPPDLALRARDLGATGDGAACTVTAPTACPTPAPSYAADIVPIITLHCYQCHDGRGPQWPLTSYQHVSDWQDGIHDDILSCQMPPPEALHPLSNDERVTILAWLRCGLPR